jgi:hypothetical protein
MMRITFEAVLVVGFALLSTRAACPCTTPGAQGTQWYAIAIWANEMMVQQLKTQYSNRSASHAEAGGDINRDEVPRLISSMCCVISKRSAKCRKPKPRATRH